MKNFLSSQYTNAYIIAIFFFLFCISLSGSVAGDEEKVLNFSQSIFNFNGSIKEWLLQNPKECLIWEKCHSSFLKHNFFWVLITYINYELIDFILSFSSISKNIFFFEFGVSIFNSSILWLAFYIIYVKYKNTYGPTTVFCGIILFIYGSYFTSFTTGGYVENILIFLISLRIFLFDKINKNIFYIIIIAIIDASLISLRFFTASIIFFHWVSYYFASSNRLKLKFVIFYFLFILFFLLIYIYFNSQIAATAFMNTDTLREINFIDYYIVKITRSFCTDGNFLSYFLFFFERIFKSFFSLSVGIFPTFPLIVICFFNKNKKILIVKLICLLSVILAYSLEDNFYLPAGIAGNRGIGPYLFFLIPEFLDGFSNLLSKYRKLLIYLGFFCILLFNQTSDFRNTSAHYTVFTALKSVEKNLPLQIYEKAPQCYPDSTFHHFHILMHPGIFSWRAFINFNVFNSKLYIYDTNNNDIYIAKKDLVPNTFLSRLQFLQQNISLSDNIYISQKKLLNNIFNNINIIEYFYWIVFLIKLAIPFGWIFIIKKIKLFY